MNIMATWNGHNDYDGDDDGGDDKDVCGDGGDDEVQQEQYEHNSSLKF